MLSSLLQGINWIDTASLQLLLGRLLIDLFFITLLIRGIYYPINRNSEFLFSFFIFNILIFFISSLLSEVRLETGFAFGLFAIFSIIRYRTEQVPIKEMTFLFISIIIATINSTVTQKVSFSEILFANLVILTLSFFLERSWKRSYKKDLLIQYEKLDLITPDNEPKMLKDLKKRTGRNIVEYEIEKINFKGNYARIRIFYVD